MESYETFRAEVLKIKGKKRFEVTHSYGTKQAWRWLKKNKWLNLGQSVTEREFGTIIKTINRLLVKQLLNGHDIKLPHGMGKIELRKHYPKIEINKGRVVTNLPVDWKRTLQLWYEDEEARSKRITIKQEAKEIFKVIYNKCGATYINKSFYQFKANREVKKAISNKIKDNELDAFLIRDYELH